MNQFDADKEINSKRTNNANFYFAVKQID